MSIRLLKVGGDTGQVVVDELPLVITIDIGVL
jgi:hypothetical protein